MAVWQTCDNTNHTKTIQSIKNQSFFNCGYHFIKPKYLNEIWTRYSLAPRNKTFQWSHFTCDSYVQIHQ